MLEILLDTLVDTLKLIPFLFVTYFMIEYLEHCTNDRTKSWIQSSNRFGPLIGGLVGAMPQCGMSAVASNLYVARVISLGTLISVYLSTSDEMLPILISERADISMIGKILGIKVISGTLAGFLIDTIYQKKKKCMVDEKQIKSICKHDACTCNGHILKSTIVHTLKLSGFILIVSLVIGLIVQWVGEEQLTNLVSSRPMLGVLFTAAIGLIPNCAVSVLITQLFLKGILGLAPMMAGLLTSAGTGILVLCKENQNIKENLMIVGILYGAGVVLGYALYLIS